MIAALVLSALAATASVHHRVSTQSPQAQAAFDRGLLLLYAYNGEAAYDSFAQALRDDPHLAMAAWGQALAGGSDLNTGITPERFARAQEAAQRALALEPFASPEERAYIEAAAARYAGSYDRAGDDNTAYRTAMESLSAHYPLDDDALMLQAEALMENRIADPQALALIERVLARSPNHVMANHLCIHAYDYAPDHAPGLRCADRIASWTLDPQEVHLAHMPAHTYITMGQYARALSAAERAWQLRQSPSAPDHYAQHDAYTGWSIAMMLGDESAAERWAQRTGTAYGGSDMWITWARFGDWEHLNGTPSPREFYAALARGLADVHAGNLPAAVAMLGLYNGADADYRYLLQAAIAERAGRTIEAVTALQRARAYQARNDVGEELPLFPAGEYLGGLFYRRGEFAQAEQTYDATLARYPSDPRALYGLALCQRALGQTESAAQTMREFNRLWTAPADPQIDH